MDVVVVVAVCVDDAVVGAPVCKRMEQSVGVVGVLLLDSATILDLRHTAIVVVSINRFLCVCNNLF